MKPHHDFIAERLVAQHAGLARPGEAQAFDPAQAMAHLSQRLALELPGALALLGGDELPEVTALDPREGVMRELLSRSAGPCSHGLLAAEAGPVLLVSLDAAGALQLVDMAFGGEGKLPDPIPEKLPLSAQLLVARIEAEVAALVARIAGIEGQGPQSPAFAPQRRNTDIAVLRPFAADRMLWQAGFEVAFGEAEAWSLRLTLAADHAPMVCGADEHDDPPRPAHAAASREPASSEHSFADIPLTLRATLVDMRVPLARIAALKPNDVLPVSVARQVPLAVGEAVVAHGTVGEMDDRVALQIIQAFSSQETPS